jgi:hypothetical protein
MKPTLALSALLALAAGAQAQVINIDQAKALAGGVTPGDAPGFPVTISQPGSYKLTGKLTVADPNLNAIHVTADNVTLDLNGFTIQGPVTCNGSLPSTLVCTAGTGTGVYADAPRAVSLRDGYVRGFKFGVYLSGPGRVENVHVADVGDRGISAFSEDSHVIGSSVRRSGGWGIWARGLVRDSSVSWAKGAGVYLSEGALATGNRISLVAGPGISGSNGAYHAAFNAISNAGAGSLWGGYSLGGGDTNRCNGQPC